MSTKESDDSENGMWYSASLLFESVHSTKTGHAPLWEERIVLIKATDEVEAAQKAQQLGQLEKLSPYTSVTGERVQWVFRKVERVYLLEPQELHEGTELFSRFLRHSEVQSLLTPFDD